MQLQLHYHRAAGANAARQQQRTTPSIRAAVCRPAGGRTVRHVSAQHAAAAGQFAPGGVSEPRQTLVPKPRAFQHNDEALLAVIRQQPVPGRHLCPPLPPRRNPVCSVPLDAGRLGAETARVAAAATDAAPAAKATPHWQQALDAIGRCSCCVLHTSPTPLAPGC